MNTQKLSEIPFLDKEQIKIRPVPSLTFFDENNWHMWINTPEGLLKFNGIPMEIVYFSKLPERENDFYFELLNFLGQKALNNEFLMPIRGISDDLMNISASIAKIKILFKLKDENNINLSRMVVTDVEYILLVCRGIFDLLQEIISKLWKTIKFIDSDHQNVNLPKKFSDIFENKNDFKEKFIIKKKYKLPSAVTSFYEKYSSFFMDLKYARDNIIHNGSTFPSIYQCANGFGIDSTILPFSKYSLWKNENLENNKIAPLRTALAYVIKTTIDACNEFTIIIQNNIMFPKEIAPNYKLFIRSDYIGELNKLPEIIENCSWDNV